MEAVGEHPGSAEQPGEGAHNIPCPCCSLPPQDNLHIVDNLELPTPDSQYLANLAQYRRWGQSVLIVDV